MDWPDLLDWLDIIIWGSASRKARRISEKLTSKRFARDLGLVMQKACFRRLPKGKYIEYHVYTKHLSREELCVFLSEGMLAQIDACTQVNVQHMSTRLVSYTIDELHAMSGILTIAITLDFEGLTADGQEVNVHLKDKQVIASLTVDPVWVWKLVKLTSVHNG